MTGELTIVYVYGRSLFLHLSYPGLHTLSVDA